MTVQSLKTINQSNPNLEHIQALKMGGSHLGNKMPDVKFFSKVVSLDPEMNTDNLKMIS